MADKKITDLQLRSNANDDINFPVDDGVQTYRTTGPQVAKYVLAKPRAIIYKTANYTAGALDHVISCDGSGGDFTIALPTAVGIEGKIYRIKRTDGAYANEVTIDPNGAQTVDGNATLDLEPGDSVTVISDNANWKVIERSVSDKFIGVTANLVSTITPGAGGIVKFDNILVNPQGAYSAATGKFTCPSSGLYLCLIGSNTTGAMEIIAKINGTAYNGSLPTINVGAFGFGQLTVPLVKGDDLTFVASSGNTMGSANSSLSISKMGA